MAKKNKLNSALAFVVAVLFLLVGAIGGVVANIYLNSESYLIPETIDASQSVAQGSIDVEVVKDEDLSIHFLELGNKYTGDCTFIKVGNVEVLIDAGSRASSVTPIYEYVSNYIDDGILEYVIVTHAHRDHFAGFATSKFEDSLFGKLKCETIITYSNTNQTDAKIYQYFNANLLKTESQNGSKVFDVLECYNNSIEGAQRTYALNADIELQFLYQEFYVNDTSSENNYSVCCMINQQGEGGEKRYLFTGDLEEKGEKSLVDEYKKEYGEELPQVELYKAGHHGSKTSSSDYLLNKIQPKVVCVCCCAGSSEYTKENANQFPTQSFIDRIAVHTKNVYVTTLCVDYTKASFESFNGNIIVSSNSSEEGVKVACANNNTLLKDTEWFKKNRTMPANWAK